VKNITSDSASRGGAEMGGAWAFWALVQVPLGIVFSVAEKWLPQTSLIWKYVSIDKLEKCMFICFLEYQREERFIYSPRPGKFPFEAVCFLALITQELPRACGDFLWFLGADFFFFSSKCKYWLANHRAGTTLLFLKLELLCSIGLWRKKIVLSDICG
jgi:hypothetical protein